MSELKQTQMLETQPAETNGSDVEEKAEDDSVWGRLLPIGAAFPPVGTNPAILIL